MWGNKFFIKLTFDNDAYGQSKYHELNEAFTHENQYKHLLQVDPQAVNEITTYSITGEL